jgi:hypothetical protein
MSAPAVVAPSARIATDVSAFQTRKLRVTRSGF